MNLSNFLCMEVDMSMDYTTPNPNKEIEEKLVKQFSEKTDASKMKAALTVIKDCGDSYTVRCRRFDDATGKYVENEGIIDKNLFESMVKAGYLQKDDATIDENN